MEQKYSTGQTVYVAYEFFDKEGNPRVDTRAVFKSFPIYTGDWRYNLKNPKRKDDVIFNVSEQEIYSTIEEAKAEALRKCIRKLEHRKGFLDLRYAELNDELKRKIENNRKEAKKIEEKMAKLKRMIK